MSKKAPASVGKKEGPNLSRLAGGGEGHLGTGRGGT